MDSNNPLVSIIVPVYNTKEEYLRECLDSIVAQTYSNIEVICVDNGSTEEFVAKTLLEYEKNHKFNIISVPENKLPGYARNLGIDAATGKYILFIDSDDTYYPNACEVAVAHAEKDDAEVTMFSFNREKNKFDAPDHLASYSEGILSGIEETYAILEFPVCWNKLLRKDFVEKNSIRFPEGYFSEDVFFCWQIYSCTKTITMIKQFLYYWRQSNCSSMKQNNKKLYADLFPILDLTREYLKKNEKIKTYKIQFMRYKLLSYYCLVTFLSEFYPKEWIFEFKKYFLQTLEPNEINCIKHDCKLISFGYITNDVVKFYADFFDEDVPLTPAFQQNNIPIVLLSSEYYVPYLGVLIKSILLNSTPDHNYDIIILHKEITEESKRILRLLCEQYNNTCIRFVNPKNRLMDTLFYIASPVYCEEAYYRILTPWILSNYEKAIVMDCDIIAKKDLADLYEIDVTGVLAGAVKDVVFQGMLSQNLMGNFDYCINEMKMNNPYDYVNTGVLLLNLYEMRKTYTEEYILEYAGSHKFRIQEQDVLNVLLEGRIKFIDYRWNFYVKLNDWISKNILHAPDETANEYNNASKKPYLIHYANTPKPWNHPDILYGYEFWKVARQSIFYETILARMSIHFSNLILQHSNNTANNTATPSILRRIANHILPYGTRRRKCIKSAWYGLKWMVGKFIG